MEIVHRYLNIVCRSTAGEEISLRSVDYDECIDEIKIRTYILNDKLNRGWIGDLTYTTERAYSCEFGEEIEYISTSEYKDVLLASVVPSTRDDGVITWEYRFLKK